MQAHSPSPLLLLLLVTGACAKQLPSPAGPLIAALADEQGRIVGSVEARTGQNGLQVSTRVYTLPQDTRWVLRLHSGEACTGHTFSDAGPAWGPPGTSGPTTFGPLVPDERGRALLNASDPAITLSGVANGVQGRPVLLVQEGSDSVPRACGLLQSATTDSVRTEGEQPQITDAWDI